MRAGIKRPENASQNLEEWRFRRRKRVTKVHAAIKARKREIRAISVAGKFLA